VPADPGEVVVRDRPDLRIVDQVTWEAARRRLDELAAAYGAGAQARRRSLPHSSVHYPRRLLSGLIACGQCGAALHIQSRPRQGVDYMGCPNHAKGTCAMATRVKYPLAEEALLGLVAELSERWPGWLATAAGAARRRVAEVAARLPEALEEDRCRIDVLGREVKNLVDALARGVTQSRSILEAVDRKEAEIEVLRARIAEGESHRGAALDLPDDAWIRGQLAGLPGLLRGEACSAAPLLRRLLAEVRAEAVIAPGKQRGYARLRVRVRANALLEEVLRGRLPQGLLHNVSQADDAVPEELVFDLGGPTRYDRLAPEIARMREQGMKFPEIGQLTGIGPGNAHNVWSRWTRAREACASG
jgi:hypothetical protein